MNSWFFNWEVINCCVFIECPIWHKNIHILWNIEVLCNTASHKHCRIRMIVNISYDQYRMRMTRKSNTFFLYPTWDPTVSLQRFSLWMFSVFVLFCFVFETQRIRVKLVVPYNNTLSIVNHETRDIVWLNTYVCTNAF